jgi:hypothetical protein
MRIVHLKKMKKLQEGFLIDEECVQRNKLFFYNFYHLCKLLFCILQDEASIQKRHGKIRKNRRGYSYRGDTQDRLFLSNETAVDHGGVLFRRGVRMDSQSSRGSGYECTGGL